MLAAAIGPREHGDMSLTLTFPTRHTDTFAATGFVHAGVLLALTEMAYARVEEHLGFSKDPDIVCMQRETRALYHAPLPWRDGASIEVHTTAVTERGFEQEFLIRSAVTGAQIATFAHRWVWLDTASGRRVDIPENVRELLRAL